jgi:phage FluMu gp28-like protein
MRRLGVRPRGDGDNAISLAFSNGSRIIGLPGKEATVRGFSAASMILIDEAARVPDEMYEALRPMLAVGDGDLWLMSTPCGQRGFFYETWTGASGNAEEWMRISVKATECPRISSSFLNGERGAMTQGKFSQEYLCEFHGDGTEYFDRELIEAAVDLSIPELRI